MKKQPNNPILTTLRIVCFIFFLLCVVSLFFSDSGNATWWVSLAGTCFVVVYVILAPTLDWKIKTLEEDGHDLTDVVADGPRQSFIKARQIVREIFLVLLAFFFIYSSIVALAGSQNAKCVFDPNMDFKAARVEWFIAVGAGLAVIGAIWAVWAKVMADKAFHAAQLAEKEAYRAYLGVTTKSIPFDQLIADRLLLKHINSANTKMRLLLGLPQVGFFYKNEGLTLVDAACQLSTEIAVKANSILDHGGEVDILF